MATTTFPTRDDFAALLNESLGGENEAFEGRVVIGTVTAIENELTVGGGAHRYLRDTFYGGGQWPILACFLGLAEAAAGSRELAMERLHWAASTANAAGEIPEQVGEHLLNASRVDEWVDRWGPIAQPLLWSHAMYVRLAVELDVIDGAVKMHGAAL